MTTGQEAAVVCQAASVLLQYPDEAFHERVPLVAAAVAELPPGPARSALRAHLDHLADTASRELAENYVATFDRRRRCCLHLTWWRDGETRRRGQALADLKARYRSRGLETGSDELPDYLPAVLEYAAMGDLTDGLALLQEHRAGIELLRLALEEAGSPHAEVVRAVCSLLPGPSPRDRAAARALARTGPPQETVGLAPYTVPSLPSPEEARR
ncbi:nitrate reductase molybdenum cofactor assembly chaperone [Streptomyces meridianus]|uniref:Nitrate reductase molybdenum cofactor assembly chaperone n=1 Tax=Streptomyces meridianus TaxID=2938945 RepID=A0ABT0XB73_9ACTN|nr:nitrate reductase molybdenum cofactor assembly chaperone [Streptomyces meridianus]MCM2579762.1 nitrate reductase molybdenum cofactor assembly chaperone [Streptomyces meridianus]